MDRREFLQKAAMTGMVASVLTMAYVKGFTTIAWTWYVLIGTAVTFGIGYMTSYVVTEEKRA